MSTRLLGCQVTAVKVAGGGAGRAGAKSLREQAFAAPLKLAEVVDKVNRDLQNVLPPIAEKMKLYLLVSATERNPMGWNIIKWNIIKWNRIEYYLCFYRVPLRGGVR
jgi:hypothetical protein